MIRLLTRLLFFVIAVLTLCDSGLPPTQEELRVDQHTSYAGHSHQANGGWADTTYKLHFVGGRLSSCSVGYSAYTGLKDGDTVDVRVTRVLGNCVEIKRGGEVISSGKYWRVFELLIGLLLLAVAFGWIRNDDESGQRVSW